MRTSQLLSIFFVSCLPAFAQASSGVGYETVQKAYEALQADPDAQTSLRGGWTIISVSKGENEGLWSFTPRSHSAFPATVRRTLKERDGQIYVDMRVLCGAEKISCDQLVEEFKKMNEAMAQEIKSRR